MRVLALNAGSRSHKAQLFEIPLPAPFDPPEPAWQASVDAREVTFDSLLEGYRGPLPDVVGHRVVHPGLDAGSGTAQRLDGAVQASIEGAVELAPEHNPLALEGIAAARRRFGERVAQIAVFDTTLGDDAPAAALAYPVPHGWRERFGIRRFGFHGISHRDCLQRTARLLGAPAADCRIVSIHLGNGGSLAAFAGGIAVETTMGFTPMEGIMMGSRSGSVDPGLIFHLLRGQRYTAVELERTLNEESGLKGVSGVSADSRDVIAAAQGGDERARFALELYYHRLRWHLGAMIAVLGGADAIAFTGPVGEHMAEIRQRVCERFEFLGITLDAARNRDARPDCEVATDGARVRVAVVRTLEEWLVARTAAETI